MVNIINDYKLVDLIGTGSYGEVWKGRHINTKKEVAIKLEKKTSKTYLKYETVILRHLHKLNNVVDIKYYGELSNHNYLIMDLLSISLNEYYNSFIRTNDIGYKIIKWIGINMLECIQSVHENGIIHKDVKPSNFLLNMKHSDIIIIDFGLSKQYINKNGFHRKNVKRSNICGTIRYISINVHDGNEPARRDDLISMIYVLIYLMKGSLPWQGVPYTNKREKVKKIHEIKKLVSHYDLCKHLPEKFIEMLDYCSGLTYEEEPNYDYIGFLMKTI